MEVFKWWFKYERIEKGWIQYNNRECCQTNLSERWLTLRGVLYWTRSGAGGAELVDHSSDVLHLSVHHSLHIVHIEQVEPLQTTLQSRDLAPGISQAGWHPIQLHLGRARARWGEEIISVRRIQSRWNTEVTIFLVLQASLKFRIKWLTVHQNGC